MAETCVVAEGGAQLVADRIEPAGRDGRDAVAALADQVLVVLAGERVEPGPVADMQVGDHAEVLQAVEVAVDRGELQLGQRAAEPAGDVLGRRGAVGGEERVQHQARGRRHAVAGLAQRRHHGLGVVDGPARAFGTRALRRLLRTADVHAPALLDASEPPERERRGPGREEQTDDRVPEEVEVQVRDDVPYPAASPSRSASTASSSTRADQQRHGPTDRPVMVTL